MMFLKKFLSLTSEGSSGNLQSRTIPIVTYKITFEIEFALVITLNDPN